MMEYVIRKNSHSSKIFGFLPHIGFTTKSSITFECKFDANCLYMLDGEDRLDINKLYGFSTSYFHHVQSVRVGWRCVDGKSIELVTYCYEKSSRIPEITLGYVNVGEQFKCSISVEKDHFAFILESESVQNVVMVKKDTKSWKFKYKLFPYFGGNQASPKKMTINIKEV